MMSGLSSMLLTAQRPPEPERRAVLYRILPVLASLISEQHHAWAAYPGAEMKQEYDTSLPNEHLYGRLLCT